MNKRREDSSNTITAGSGLVLQTIHRFHVNLPWVNTRLAQCLNSVLNVKALVDAFNQEQDLVGAFSVIVQLHRLIDLRH